MNDDGFPLAYLLTFTCYGTWLHGDDRGSIDRRHNAFDAPGLEPNGGWLDAARSRLRSASVHLDVESRRCIELTIREVCEHRGWELWALNARSNHVHVVVSAGLRPERVLSDLKSWSSRRLIEQGSFARGARIWTRHGSTRYLWAEPSVEAACDYVEHGQGSPPQTWR